MRSKEVDDSIETLKSWLDYNKKHKNMLLKADEIIEVQENILSYISELENKVERFNKQLDLDYVDNNFVSKDKIRNKLKELLKKLDEPNNDRWEKDDNFYYGKIKAKIQVLKELLEGE